MEERAVKMDERRALLARISGQAQAGAGEARSLSEESQAALKLLQQCYAACYALMSYVCYMPNDEFPDSVYAALYECWQCAGLCITLTWRESSLSRAAHQLLASACGEVVATCAGFDDVILKACAVVCDSAAKGSGEEGRASHSLDEVRACKIEFRASEDGHIKGYPIVFNQLSQDLGGFYERILPTAVTFDPDVKADFNHNPDYILGRCLAGTLAVSADARGVCMDVTPPDTTWARDLKVSIDRGDIDQGSFAFRVLPGGQQISEENGVQVRTLSKILVRRVSVVSDPAYTKTSIEVRSKQGDQNTAGQAAPPASSGSGGVSVILLRRKLDLAELG